MKYRRIHIFFLIAIILGINGFLVTGEQGAAGNRERLMGKLNCPGPIRSTPVSSRETIYIGCDSGHLFAINRGTGNIRWSFPADAAIASKPVVTDDLIFFTTKRGTLYAVYQHQHELEGKEAWRFASNNKAVSLYEGGWDYFISSPSIAGDLVIFGSGDHYVYALQRQTGKLVWKYDTGEIVRATPAGDNKTNTVFCGTMAGELLALEVKSGTVKWKFKTSGNKYFPKGELLFEPLVYKDTVYVGSRDASFYAINSVDGSLRWKVSDLKGAWYTTAAAEGDTVFACSSDGHYVQALDCSSGKEKWKFYTDDLIFSTPFLSEGILYVGSHDSHVYAVDDRIGKLIWRYRLGDDVLGSAIIDKGMLIIGCDDGILYGLRPGRMDSSPGGKFFLAVYWDIQLDSKVTTRVANIHDTVKIYSFFWDLGYEALDASGLEQFIRDRINDRQAASSVIILASVVYPYSLYQGDENSPPLLRQYLEAGGSFISVGYPPFLFALKADATKPEVPTKEIMNILKIDTKFFFNGFGYYDAYISYPTETGKRLGLPGWWSSGYGVNSDNVTTVLGIDEHNRATAWIKSFGGPEGTGLIRLWGNDQLPQDMTFIKKIAEGLVSSIDREPK